MSNSNAATTEKAPEVNQTLDQPKAAVPPTAGQPQPGLLSRMWVWTKNTAISVYHKIGEFFGSLFTMNMFDRILDGIKGLSALAIIGGILLGFSTVASVGIVTGLTAYGVQMLAQAINGYEAPALPVVAKA